MLNYYRYFLKSIRRIKKKKNLMNCNRKLMKKRLVEKKHQRDQWNWKLHANHKERRSLFLPLSSL